MCGIVGYVGSQQAAPILLAGLEKLEYRGYDSAGLAVRAIWYIVGYPISRMRPAITEKECKGIIW